MAAPGNQLAEAAAFRRGERSDPPQVTKLLTEYMNLRRLIPTLGKEPVAQYAALAELVDIGLTIALEVKAPVMPTNRLMESLQAAAEAASTPLADAVCPGGKFDPESFWAVFQEMYEHAEIVREEQADFKRWQDDVRRMKEIHEELRGGNAVAEARVLQYDYKLDHEGRVYDMKDDQGALVSSVLEEDALPLGEKVSEQWDRREHRKKLNVLRGYRREIEQVMFHHGILDLRTVIRNTIRAFGQEEYEDSLLRSTQVADSLVARPRVLELAPPARTAERSASTFDAEDESYYSDEDPED